MTNTNHDRIHTESILIEIINRADFEKKYFLFTRNSGSFNAITTVNIYIVFYQGVCFHCIDLTTSRVYCGIIHVPIRPPTPFADSAAWPPPLVLNNIEDNDVNGMMTWSLPDKYSTVNYKIDTYDNNFISSSSSSTQSAWRRKINKLLKRAKPIEYKPVNSDATAPYDFGVGDRIQLDASTSRNTKRVHWIDDDETILSACQRFVENLRLLVQNCLHDVNEENSLQICQISLDELDTLIDSQYVRKEFEDLVELIKDGNTSQLLEQQIHIENLLSRAILSSSA